MRPKTIVELPAGYGEVLQLKLTQRSNFALLNVLAVPLLVISSVIFLGLLLVYIRLGSPFVIASLAPAPPSQLAIVAIMIGILLLHEIIHGEVIRYYGHRPRYGMKLSKGVLFATADGAFFWRDQYVAIALAPLVLISAGSLLLSLFLPVDISLWVMLAAAINAAGSIGDLWAALKVRPYAKNALIKDEADSFRVYTPQPPM